MSPVHCAPEDSVLLHQDVRSRQSVGIHYGTWRLTPEPVFEPLALLEKACERAQIPYGFAKGGFGVVKIGESGTVNCSTN